MHPNLQPGHKLNCNNPQCSSAAIPVHSALQTLKTLNEGKRKKSRASQLISTVVHLGRVVDGKITKEVVEGKMIVNLTLTMNYDEVLVAGKSI